MRVRDVALSIFPPPSMIAMPAAGIDIGEGGVKCVFLKHTGGTTRLASYAEIAVPPGAGLGSNIEAPEKIIEVLRSFKSRYGIEYANASLPEKRAYLYQSVVPAGSGDLRSSVEFDLETHVPLPAREIVFDFEPVRNTEGGTLVSVTAYAKRVAEQYVDIFRRAGITLAGLEVESQSLARATLKAADKEMAVMFIDLGRRSTKIAIADSGIVSFTATVPVGGDVLTAAVTKLFKISPEEAEKIKDEKGFLMNAENKNLLEALMITVSVIKDEVAKNLSYWNTPREGEPPRRPIGKILVLGGAANLRGFPEYLEGALNVPVSIANVWANAFSFDEYVPPIPFSESLRYGTAIGLALRSTPNQPW